MMRRNHPVTRTVRAGIDQDDHHGAVVPPIHLSSTFSFAGFDQKRRYDYSRSGNPTRDHLATALADLEAGAGAVVTASGMAAVTLTLQQLRPGELLIGPHDCYGGTYRLMHAMALRGHFDVRFVDLTAADAAEVVRRAAPRMLWIETPSNPLLRITDIAQLARAAGDALVVADNTFLSPVLQQPLAHGAHVVVHSTTKYLNGHSDVVGGAVVAKDEALVEELAWWANCLGLTGSPFDAYLTLRGLRTVHARMRAHESNARTLAERLGAHPAVARVYYPGLRQHPGHAVALRQQAGGGGMVSFELRERASIQALVSGLRLITLAESLGGVESLIAHPATMTHASMDPQARQVAGISDALLRLSVGIEHVEDLWDDLADGLERALRESTRAAPSPAPARSTGAQPFAAAASPTTAPDAC